MNRTHATLIMAYQYFDQKTRDILSADELERMFLYLFNMKISALKELPITKENLELKNRKLTKLIDEFNEFIKAWSLLAIPTILDNGSLDLDLLKDSKIQWGYVNENGFNEFDFLGRFGQLPFDIKSIVINREKEIERKYQNLIYISHDIITDLHKTHFRYKFLFDQEFNIEDKPVTKVSTLFLFYLDQTYSVISKKTRIDGIKKLKALDVLLDEFNLPGKSSTIDKNLSYCYNHPEKIFKKEHLSQALLLLKSVQDIYPKAYITAVNDFKSYL